MDEVQRIKAKAKPRLEMKMRSFANEDHRATLAILERRYPEDWGKKDTINIKDRTGEPDLPKDEDALPLILEELDNHPEVKAAILKRLEGQH
jgi:hypothetical protein